MGGGASSTPSDVKQPGVDDELAAVMKRCEAGGGEFSFPENSGKDKRENAVVNFPGRIVKDQRFFIASFPGKFGDEWTNLVGAVNVSTACVFFPKKSTLYGGHAKDDSVGDQTCHCAFLYGKVESWGCAWYQCWKQLLHEAIDQGQTPVVVYFGDVTCSDWGPPSEWGPLTPCGENKVFHEHQEQVCVGLGNSQEGEVRYLESYLESIVPPPKIHRVSIATLKKVPNLNPEDFCFTCGCVNFKIKKVADLSSNDVEHQKKTCEMCGDPFDTHTGVFFNTLNDLPEYMLTLAQGVSGIKASEFSLTRKEGRMNVVHAILEGLLT